MPSLYDCMTAAVAAGKESTACISSGSKAARTQTGLSCNWRLRFFLLWAGSQVERGSLACQLALKDFRPGQQADNLAGCMVGTHWLTPALLMAGMGESAMHDGRPCPSTC